MVVTCLGAKKTRNAKFTLTGKRQLLRNSENMTNGKVLKQSGVIQCKHGSVGSSMKQLFSSSSVKYLTDPNPIIGDGAPNTVVGIVESCT